MVTSLPNDDPGSSEAVANQTERTKLVGVMLGAKEQEPTLTMVVMVVVVVAVRSGLGAVGAIEGMGEQIDWNGRIKIGHELRENVDWADPPVGWSPPTGTAFECVGVHDEFGAVV